MKVLLGLLVGLIVLAVVGVALGDERADDRQAGPSIVLPTATPTAVSVGAPSWVEVRPGAGGKPSDYVAAVDGGKAWRLSLNVIDQPTGDVTGWTADGQAIVEVRQDGRVFYFLGYPGEELSRSSARAIAYSSTMLSADGKYLAELRGLSSGQPELEVRDAETLETLATMSTPGAGPVNWSADGQFLSISFPAESKVVIWDWKQDEGQELPASRSAWSHEGARLAYIPQSDRTSPGLAQIAIVIRNMDSETETEVARTRAGVVGLLAWSRDDTTLSFSSAGNAGHETLLVDATGRRPPMRVTGSFMQTWEPSGDRLAFVGNWCTTFDIFTVSQDGSNLRNNTGSQRGGLSPAWSPDGTSIAYTRSPGPDRAGVSVVDTDSGTSRPILDVQSGAALSVVGWSPDGKYVAVDSGGGRGLCEGTIVGETTIVEPAS